MGLKPCSWVLSNCQRVYQGFKTIFLNVACSRHVSLVSKPCAWKGASRRRISLVSKPCAWKEACRQRVFWGFETMRMEGGMPSTRFLRFRNHIPERGMSPTRFLGFETMLLEGCRPSTRLARFRNHMFLNVASRQRISLVSKPCSWKGACHRHVFWGFEIMFRSSDSLVYLLTRWQNDKTLDHSFAYMPYQHVDKYCLCVDKMTKYYVVFKGYCTLVRWKIM